MNEQTAPSVRPQPMIAVADVEKASRWYQQVLGATSGHGGAEYEQLLVDGRLVMQLHRLEIGHHHGVIAEPGLPLGNGLALWFEAADFDAAVRRIRSVSAQIVTDVHVNPNAGHREIWIRDLDGYLVVFAEPYHEPDRPRA
jgi:catechol 2,3-dioxygenase-like lactoylglutathione lyase family enzyme